MPRILSPRLAPPVIPMAERPPYGCAGCTSRWGGLRTAHCGACHVTFSGLTLFDKHRTAKGAYGECIDPATLTDHGQQLRLVEGIWRSPAIEGEYYGGTLAGGRHGS